MSKEQHPSLLSIVVIKTMTKSDLVRKGFVWLTGHYQSLLLREDEARIKQGRKLEAEVEAETMEKSCLLACSS